MSSNSLRVTEELFQRARAVGEVMSRSTAQQVEHWSRLGMALEAAGVRLRDVEALLREGPRDLPAAPEEDIWARKRAKQQADLANVRAGLVAPAEMSWFAGGRAKAAKLVNSPY